MMKRPFASAQPDRVSAGAQDPRQAAADPLQVSPRQLAQRERIASSFGPIAQLQTDAEPNRTGLPDSLKAGIESLSGMDMSEVRVHRNSDQPAQLNALAYAQGNDIHLAPGQEQHLPHEAWHVVQQAQGRVAPTRQMRDAVPVNDDDALEREADAMGARALGGGAAFAAGAQGPERQPMQRKEGVGGAGTVAQRKIGFEFETGWAVSRQGQPLAKKTAIGSLQGNAWKVEADDGGRMEFIVHPPLEISDELQDRLAVVFTEMEAACRTLLEVARSNAERVQSDDDEPAPNAMADASDFAVGAFDGDSGSDVDDDDAVYDCRPFSLQLVTEQDADMQFIVQPPNLVLAGNPQTTAGMALDQIAQVSAHDGQNTKARYAIGGMQSKVGALTPRLPGTLRDYGLDAPPSAQLQGLLMLIASYLIGGNQPAALEYPKQLTDTFLLSRTEFSHLFRLIETNEREHFAASQDRFVQLCLAVAGLPLNSGDAQVIVPGLAGAGGAVAFGPSRRAWLEGITQGVDLMSHRRDARYESMGEFGARTEPVKNGKFYAQGGIFEVRVGQTSPLEYTDWRRYAAAMADLVLSMQPDSLDFLDEK